MAARRRDVTIRPEPVRVEARVPSPHITVLTARAIEIAALIGFSFGLPVVSLSTIRFTPQDGFDGWWTRLSEGFAIAGFVAGLLSWLLSWRVELEWETPGERGWDMRTLNLSLKDRRGRPLISGRRLIAVLLIPTALCAIVWSVIAMG
jgi:hypothetical protein